MKLSIVVPVYRVEDTLSRCVDSVLSQSYSDYETMALPMARGRFAMIMLRAILMSKLFTRPTEVCRQPATPASMWLKVNTSPSSTVMISLARTPFRYLCHVWKPIPTTTSWNILSIGIMEARMPPSLSLVCTHTMICVTTGFVGRRTATLMPAIK